MDLRPHLDFCWIKGNFIENQTFPDSFPFYFCVLVDLPAEIVAAQPQLQCIGPPSVVELVRYGRVVPREAARAALSDRLGSSVSQTGAQHAFLVLICSKQAATQSVKVVDCCRSLEHICEKLHLQDIWEPSRTPRRPGCLYRRNTTACCRCQGS